ncbi:hypothetical protein [Roseofilum casamattae]|uniref:PEP-CTERM protein-sorting domain-containing protein n=1 Tax=Roseofilum casamattae BLCC-M143 TaxID=3022442 RepID=A0ABT7BSW4_9CYAN|nr:hypothetical protein [Roseofilum casamattae]MDJ1181867.1 hypothetical protein [Roseofilum casamattae BLCC-M143]
MVAKGIEKRSQSDRLFQEFADSMEMWGQQVCDGLPHLNYLTFMTIMNTINKHLACSAAILGVTTSLLCLFPERAEAGLKFVQDAAICSATPTQVPGANIGDTISNGDCTIERTGANSTLGSGVDERTWWTFDFSDQIESSVKEILKADFVLSFIPQGISTDRFRIAGFPSIERADWGVGPLANGQETDLVFNLLDFYQPEQIQSVLNENDFKLDMFYADDAIITEVQLSLLVDVPEPSGVIALLAFSALGFGKLRRRSSGS